MFRVADENYLVSEQLIQFVVALRFLHVCVKISGRQTNGLRILYEG